MPPPPHPRVLSEPPRPPEEEVGGRRGDFTRQEYERRQQLKLMEELEKVLRPPRGTPRGSRGPPRGPPRGPRPRCCDDSALARSPPKGLLGTGHGAGDDDTQATPKGLSMGGGGHKSPQGAPQWEGGHGGGGGGRQATPRGSLVWGG